MDKTEIVQVIFKMIFFFGRDFSLFLLLGFSQNLFSLAQTFVAVAIGFAILEKTMLTVATFMKIDTVFILFCFNPIHGCLT